MKLIFKIYKKLRQLKRQQKEVKEKIERYKLDSNKYLKEEEMKLKISILQLRKKIEEGWIDLHTLSQSGYLDEVKKDYELKDKEIERQEEKLQKREEVLDQREKELNKLQQKINDQILKLGILQGVNK